MTGNARRRSWRAPRNGGYQPTSAAPMPTVAPPGPGGVGFPLSREAAEFIETAKILSEPYNERIEALTAERDAASAELAAERAKVQAVDAETRTVGSALWDDVHAEIGLATGLDDSDDGSRDFKHDLTSAVLRHFRAALAAAQPTGETP